MGCVFHESKRNITRVGTEAEKKTSLILKEKISERKRVVRTSEKIG